MDKQTVKLALIGFGNVGQAFVRLLLDKQEEIDKEYGCQVLVTVIATGSRGCFYNPEGLDLSQALADLSKTEKSPLTTDELIQQADYDVLLELTPLNIETGQPAISHVEAALSGAKHVITANKGPIAIDYRRLSRIAQEKGAKFLFETTVMDGAPIFNLVKDTLPLCKITGFRGILNSTTNFLLEEMAKGVSYEDALAEGRRRGFVEADPAMDTRGFDAAGKTAALLNVLMDGNVTPEDIEREGIEKVTLEDLARAEKEGKVLKLICRGEMIEGKAKGSVKLEAIDKKDMLAGVTGTTSILSIHTDLMKTVTVVEHEPDIEQTAYGPFSDLLRILS